MQNESKGLERWKMNQQQIILSPINISYAILLVISDESKVDKVNDSCNSNKITTIIPLLI